MPSFDDPLRFEQQAVVYQVCAAGPYKPDGVRIDKADIVPVGANSISGGWQWRTGFSSTGQPIFEQFSATRQIDIAAVIVGDNSDHEFVFFLHHPPLSADWTEWEDAQSQNPKGESVGMQIIDADAGRKPIFQAPTIRPFKMRFRLIRMDAYRSPSMNDIIPAC